MPQGVEAAALALAAGAWTGSLTARWWLAMAGLSLVVATAKRTMAAAFAVGLLAGAAAGHGALARESATIRAPVPEGSVAITATALTDSVAGPVLIKPSALGGSRWDGPVLLVRGASQRVAVGDVVAVAGAIDGEPSRYRGKAIGGVIRARSVTPVGTAINPVLAIGNALRRHVLAGLDSEAERPAGALLSGFLIGDVSRLPDADREALRAAGLSHFVAVSGSNVALFLAAWWLVTAPLGSEPRRRAMLGLAGVVVFAVVTRWEPSVVRASVMAGIVLVGKLAGRPVTPWTALGGAAFLALLVAPDLAGDAGFGLSVAASGGIIAGHPIWADRSPRPVWAVLGATVSAQVAVAPLLLFWFGQVPLAAPVTNLVAAPLVSLATALGGLGAACHVGPLVRAGTVVAGVVLGVAHGATELPQMGVTWTGVLGLLAFGAVRLPILRVVLAVAVVGAIGMSAVPPRLPTQPIVDFLDVGQGDATLFRGPLGEVILVDGGPDPALLRHHLARYGIRRIDLVVISHRHSDHTAGLVGLFDQVAVGALWYPAQLGDGPPFDEVVAEAVGRGVPAITPSARSEAQIGSFYLEVLAPRRRFAGINDGSIVVLVRAGPNEVLMSGDIERVAQAELGPLPADILKVPHQGAATSDLGWLRASAPSIAVISVGPNDFGHPSRDVMDTLAAAGSVVLRTDHLGTIELPLDVPASATPLPSQP